MYFATFSASPKKLNRKFFAFKVAKIRQHERRVTDAKIKSRYQYERDSV